MKNLKVFTHEQFGQIRCTEKNGEPWFVGKDVAQALGYKRSSNAIAAHIDDEDKMYEMVGIKVDDQNGILLGIEADPQNGDLLGIEADPQNGDLLGIEADPQNGALLGKTKTIFINESGLYALILSSRLDNARQFKHWVTSTVLPQIRRTGGYIPTQGATTEADIQKRARQIADATIVEFRQKLTDLESANRQLTTANRQLQSDNHQLTTTNTQLNDHIKNLAPKAWYSEEVLNADRTYTMTEVAKSLAMTVHQLTEVLHDNHIIFRQSGIHMLYAPLDQLGLARTRTVLIPDMFHDNDVHTYLVWTERGKYFLSLFIQFGLATAIRAIRTVVASA